MKIVFDNFKTVQTAVRARELNPRWDDSFSFAYSTRYADCLARKFCVFEVYDHNNFSANALIGHAKVDLHTLATGCAAQELVVRDGRKVRGTLFADVRFEEVAEAASLRFDKLFVEGKDAAATAALERLKDAQIVLDGPAAQHLPSTPFAGALLRSAGWPRPPPVALRGSVPEIMANFVDITIVAPAGRDVVAAGRLLLANWRSFVSGEMVDFLVPLDATAAGKSAGLGGGLVARGSLTFAGLPGFSQLEGGVRVLDGSIRGGAVGFPDLPNLPKMQLFDAAGREFSAGIMARDFAAKRGKVAGALAKAAPSTRTLLTKDGVSERAAVPVDLSKPLYTPGVAGMKAPPAPVERLFGGAPNFPVCWVRRENPATQEVAFENLCTGLVETALPIDSEFVVTIAASATGPLGLQMEANFSGRERFGVRSGRRNSGFDLGAVVRAVKPDTILSRVGRLRPGHHLISVNGAACDRLNFADTVAQLKAAGRPLVMRFHDPYAVPPNVAALAVKSNVNEKQATGSNQTLGGRRLDHTMLAKKHAGNKKQVQMAQETLAIALKMLGKFDVAKADAAAARGGSEEAEQLVGALNDPGLMRTVTASATGNAMDAAPAQVREELERANRERAALEKRKADRESTAPLTAVEEERERAAVAEELDNRDAEQDDEAEASRPVTSEAAAESAVAALRNLGTGGGVDAAADADVRALVEERATKMAKAGVWARVLDAVAKRGAPGFSAAAVGGVAAVASAHEGVAMKDLGLDGQALIAVQNAARRIEFKGEMIEAVKGLGRGLASENEDQDGEGYLRLVAECVEGIAAFTNQHHSRVLAKDGSTVYTTAGGSDTTMPAAMRGVFDKLVRLDRLTRVIDDNAVTPGTRVSVSVSGASVPLLKALPFAIEGQESDSFIVSVLLGCAAKLAYLPSNSHVMLEEGQLLNIVDQTLALHPRDLRMSECVAALYFNVGRELDNSASLLQAGVVAKVTALARAYLKSRQTFTGSVCSWPPAGKEAEVGETIVLPSSVKLARDKNMLRPRLVRSCINVLINLACYRKPVASGTTSVDLIVSCRGVELLGEVLLAHISDASVVTSVLNCAANIAFKNREVQLAIGQSMTDAIVLSGWSFQRDATLLSMALRAIGNLTNEDVNIYRGLGFGVLRMMSAAMRNNGSDVALQTLAASVLSNVASVEAVEDPSLAAEDLQLFAEVHALRCAHPAVALRPEAADVANVQRLLRAGMQTWQITPWLMLDEGAVACLVSTMQRNPTDVTLVDACLRTLTCVSSSDNAEVSAALIARHDLVGKTLFVMRAADFDVSVQMHGVTLLHHFAATPLTLPSVVATDAALMLLMAVETHKAALVGALQQAAGAIQALPDRGDGQLPQQLANALAAALDGRPMQVLALATKICDTVTLLGSSGVRAAKAALELSSPLTVATLLQSALGVFNAMARRGFSFVQPRGSAAALSGLMGFVESSSQLLASWVRHPAARAALAPGADGRVVISADEEAACFAARDMLTGGGRSHVAFARLCELCVLGTGEPGSPATLAVTIRCARAVVGILAALLVRGAALPEFSNAGNSEGSQAGAPTAPFLEVDGRAVEGIAGSGGCATLGALLLAGCQAIIVLLVGQTEQWRARGYVQFDSAATTARLLVSQAAVLLDLLGSVAASQDDAGLCADIADAASAAIAGVAAANEAFLAADLTPGPLRVADVAGSCARSAASLGRRVAAAAAPSAPLAAQPPSFSVSEARSLFCYSLSRARAQATAGAGYGRVPGGAAAAHAASSQAIAVPRAPSTAATSTPRCTVQWPTWPGTRLPAR